MTSEWSSVTASSIFNLHRTKMNSSHAVIISRTQTIPTVSLMLVTSIVYANNISSTSDIFSSTSMPSFIPNISYYNTTYSEQRSINASHIKTVSSIFSNNSQTLIKTRTTIFLINSSSISTTMPSTAVSVSLTILPTTAKVIPTSSPARSKIDSKDTSLMFSISLSATTKMSASRSVIENNTNSTKTKFLSSFSTFSIISIEPNNYSSTINSVSNYSLLSSPASSDSVSFARIEGTTSKYHVLISSYESCWITFYMNETDRTSMTPDKPILSTKVNNSNVVAGIESTSVVTNRVQFSANNITAVYLKSLLVSVKGTSTLPEENRSRNVTILNTSIIIEASFSTVILLQINSTSPTTSLTSFRSLSMKNLKVKTSRNSISFVSKSSTVHNGSRTIAAQTNRWKSSTSTIANMTSKENSTVNSKNLSIPSSVNGSMTSMTVVNSTKSFNSQIIFDSTSSRNTSEKAAVLNRRRRNIENGTSKQSSQYIMPSTTISDPLFISSSIQINVTSLLNTTSKFGVRITSSLEGIVTSIFTKTLHPTTASLSNFVTTKSETMTDITRNIFSSILNSIISSNGTNMHGSGTIISKIVDSSRGVNISRNKISSSNKISSLTSIRATLETSTVSSTPSLPKITNNSETPNTTSKIETKVSPRYSHNVRNQSSIKVVSFMPSSQPHRSVSEIPHATQLLTSTLSLCLRVYSTVAMKTSVPSSGIFSLTSAQLHTSTLLRTNFSTINSLSTLLTKQPTKATDLSSVISTSKNATSSKISSSFLPFSSSLSFALVSVSSMLKLKLTGTVTSTNMSLSSSTMKKSSAQINTSSIAPSTKSKSTSSVSSAAVLISAKISSVSATTTTGVLTSPSSKSTPRPLSSKRKPISTTDKESNTLILTSGTKTATVSRNSFKSSIMKKTPTATLAASSSATTSVIPPTNNFGLILMLVLNDSAVDVTAANFKSDLEQKLVNVYVDLGSILRKRRRGEATNGNTTVEVSRSDVILVMFL